MSKINVTRWSPDTCECVLEYSWDADVPVEQRVHTPTTVVKQCAAHAAVSKKALHNAVLNENQTKNVMLQEIIEAVPSHAVIDEKGNKSPDLEKIKWSFDENRKIRFDLPQAKTSEKAAVQSVMNAKFAGKADVQ